MPPAEGGGRNAKADSQGQSRSNDTHASTPDPDARLYRKGKGKEAKLCFMGHGLMENRFLDEIEEVVIPNIHLDDAPAAGKGLGEAGNLGHQPVSAMSFGSRTRL